MIHLNTQNLFYRYLVSLTELCDNMNLKRKCCLLKTASFFPQSQVPWDTTLKKSLREWGRSKKVHFSCDLGFKVHSTFSSQTASSTEEAIASSVADSRERTLWSCISQIRDQENLAHGSRPWQRRPVAIDLQLFIRGLANRLLSKN